MNLQDCANKLEKRYRARVLFGKIIIAIITLSLLYNVTLDQKQHSGVDSIILNFLQLFLIGYLVFSIYRSSKQHPLQKEAILKNKSFKTKAFLEKHSDDGRPYYEIFTRSEDQYEADFTNWRAQIFGPYPERLNAFANTNIEVDLIFIQKKPSLLLIEDFVFELGKVNRVINRWDET